MKKIRIGDIVIIPAELAELTHEEKGTQIAEVVGLYNHFFNVKYEIGFQQSILWKDVNKVKLLLDRAV